MASVEPLMEGVPLHEVFLDMVAAAVWCSRMGTQETARRNQSKTQDFLVPGQARRRPSRQETG